jgi:hypothetical protein
MPLINDIKYQLKKLLVPKDHSANTKPNDNNPPHVTQICII